MTATMMETPVVTALAATGQTTTDFGKASVYESVPLTPTVQAATVTASPSTCAGTRGEVLATH